MVCPTKPQGNTVLSLVFTGDLLPCRVCVSWLQAEEFASHRWPFCGNIWLHALCSVCWKWTTLPAGKADRHIPSAKAVVAPSWAINAPNPHVSKWSYKIPNCSWEDPDKGFATSQNAGLLAGNIMFKYA